MSLASFVVPGTSKRTDFPLVGDRCALLIVDIQKYLSLPRSPEEAAEKAYFFDDASPSAIDRIRKLTEAFRVVRDDPTGRKSGFEVIFTYLQSATRDGRDISLDYKLSGPDLANIPRFGMDYHDIFLESLPVDPNTGKGDILLPKTSCNVFVSTNIDYMLRNLGVEQVVIVGQLTDECVESAVRSAADLGYFVTVVEDACASLTTEKHQKGLDGVKGFARIVKTAEMLDEIVEGIASEMDGSSKTKSSISPEMNDDSVLTYLRNKGLHKVAKQLDMMFTIQNLSKRDKKDDKTKTAEEKKDEDMKPPRSPRRRNHKVKQNNQKGNRGDFSDGDDGVRSTEHSEDRRKEKTNLESSLTFEDLVVEQAPVDVSSPTRTTPPPPVATAAAAMPSPPLSRSPRRNRSSKKLHESDRFDEV